MSKNKKKLKIIFSFTLFLIKYLSKKYYFVHLIKILFYIIYIKK